MYFSVSKVICPVGDVGFDLRLEKPLSSMVGVQKFLAPTQNFIKTPSRSSLAHSYDSHFVTFWQQ